ncbi:MAG: hypothetical protein CMM90_04425 [Rickettsiales bacterium]|nr:hypothetical protein [Rickettsiales bacterium]
MTKIFLNLFFLLNFFFISDCFAFQIKWTVDGLNEPESAVYDKKTNAIYVSSINGNPLELDNNGYISKLSVSGQILEKKWITGLDGPKGLAVFKNFLYVSDINKIWKISLKNKIKTKFKVNDAGFLNDVVVDKNGDVYTSDMFKNRIYRLKKNKINIWKQSELLNSPNGLLIEGNNLIISTWGKIKEGFQTEIKGKLIKVNLRTREIKKFFSTRPIGNLDGIVFNKNNGYLVTDWISGKLLTVNKKGIVVESKKINKGAADLEILMHKNLILIPMMQNNNLSAFQIN